VYTVVAMSWTTNPKVQSGMFFRSDLSIPLTCRGVLDGREIGQLVCRFVLELPNIPLLRNAIPEGFYSSKGAK
jgi:hypothetical protein